MLMEGDTLSDEMVLQFTENCIIGVLPHERETKQPLHITLTIETDFSKASHSDELSDTIDYAEVYSQLQRLISGSNFQLLEKLGETILETVVLINGIKAATLILEKPDALPGDATIRLKFKRREA